MSSSGFKIVEMGFTVQKIIELKKPINLKNKIFLKMLEILLVIFGNLLATWNKVLDWAKKFGVLSIWAQF